MATIITITEDTNPRNLTPTTVYGGFTSLQMLWNATVLNRAIMRIPLAGIPDPAPTCNLELYISAITGSGHTVNFGVIDPAKPFVEAECTYNLWSTGNSWTVGAGLGCALDDLVVGAPTVNVPQPTVTSAFWQVDITTLIQHGLDNAYTDLDLLMWLDETGSGVFFNYNSAEGTNPPRVVVETEGGVALLGVSSTTGRFQELTGRLDG